MAIATFDGVNLRIILPAGTPLIDVERDIYSAWKEWYLLGDNAKFPLAFRGVGGDNLTPGIDAGAYFFMQNQVGWRIRPAEEDATVTFVGNLAPEDSSIPILVPTTGNFRVLINGLQPITQSVETILTQGQNSEYQGVVSINTFSGTPGTTYPIGTASLPVNNLADALTIMAQRGFSQISLVGTITLTEAFTFKRIDGQIGVANVNVNGQNVSGTQFELCAVFGDFSSVNPATPPALFRCFVPPPGITNFVGNMGECLFGSTISLQAGQTNMNRCLSNVPGTGRPIVDLQGNAADLSMRAYTGGVEIRNVTNALSDLSLDLAGARLTVDSTVTAGTIVVGGVGTVTDNGTVTLNDASFIDGTDLMLIRQMVAGNATVSPDDLTITVFDEDGTTPLATFSISADGRIRTRTS